MDKSMQKYLDKAEVLIEALPYFVQCISGNSDPVILDRDIDFISPVSSLDRNI